VLTSATSSLLFITLLSCHHVRRARWKKFPHGSPCPHGMYVASTCCILEILEDHIFCNVKKNEAKLDMFFEIPQCFLPIHYNDFRWQLHWFLLHQNRYLDMFFQMSKKLCFLLVRNCVFNRLCKRIHSFIFTQLCSIHPLASTSKGYYPLNYLQALAPV